MSDEWTNDHAKAWADTWNQPHMQMGMRQLEEKAKVAVMPRVDPGYDALVLAAGEHHRNVGNQEILTEIERLKQTTPERKSIPEPFTREARGETDPPK